MQDTPFQAYIQDRIDSFRPGRPEARIDCSAEKIL
jgi:hypothetical protein